MAEKDRCRVVLLGNPGVGKTALISQYVTQTFPSRYHPTQLDSWSRTETVEGHSVAVDLTDCSSNADWADHRKPYLANADVLVLVYSVADRQSLLDLERHLIEAVLVRREAKENYDDAADDYNSTAAVAAATQEAEHYHCEVPIFVVGTHTDVSTSSSSSSSSSRSVVSTAQAEKTTRECLQLAGLTVSEDAESRWRNYFRQALSDWGGHLRPRRGRSTSPSAPREKELPTGASPRLPLFELSVKHCDEVEVLFRAVVRLRLLVAAARQAAPVAAAAAAATPPPRNKSRGRGRAMTPRVAALPTMLSRLAPRGECAMPSPASLYDAPVRAASEPPQPLTAEMVVERSGPRRPAPSKPGTSRHPSPGPSQPPPPGSSPSITAATSRSCSAPPTDPSVPTWTALTSADVPPPLTPLQRPRVQKAVLKPGRRHSDPTFDAVACPSVSPSSPPPPQQEPCVTGQPAACVGSTANVDAQRDGKDDHEKRDDVLLQRSDTVPLDEFLRQKLGRGGGDGSTPGSGVSGALSETLHVTPRGVRGVRGSIDTASLRSFSSCDYLQADLVETQVLTRPATPLPNGDGDFQGSSLPLPFFSPPTEPEADHMTPRTSSRQLPPPPCDRLARSSGSGRSHRTVIAATRSCPTAPIPVHRTAAGPIPSPQMRTRAAAVASVVEVRSALRLGTSASLSHRPLSTRSAAGEKERGRYSEAAAEEEEDGGSARCESVFGFSSTEAPTAASPPECPSTRLPTGRRAKSATTTTSTTAASEEAVEEDIAVEELEAPTVTDGAHLRSLHQHGKRPWVPADPPRFRLELDDEDRVMQMVRAAHRQREDEEEKDGSTGVVHPFASPSVAGGVGRLFERSRVASSAAEPSRSGPRGKQGKKTKVRSSRACDCSVM